MPRNAEYRFVDTDTNALVTQMITAYEQITGISVQPASPEKLFVQWVANIIIQERVLNNYTGNQNIPSRAEGENLDALGELFCRKTRPDAQPAVCTERFCISEAQNSAVLIPSGTRVTDASNTLLWQTTADAYIPIGQAQLDLPVQCTTAGTVGNGYAVGQLGVLVDLFPYYSRCENITASDGGADRASDEEFYELMRASMDTYSCAGAKGGYIYFAKQVSTEIKDVVANSPSAGQVALYVLMQNGEIAGTEIKNAVLAACNASDVRPLTDYVQVSDPETAEYTIDFTYYISADSTLNSAEIQTAIDTAVSAYTAWQSGKLGRDINPSYLVSLLMQTGIKRVEVMSPVFTPLRDGSDNTVPQIAKSTSISAVNGGYENE